jgi:hypothetical protein
MTTYPPFLSFERITTAFYFVLFAIKKYDDLPLFLPLERIAAAFSFVLLATKIRRPTLLFSLLNALLPYSISFFLLSKSRTTYPLFLPLERIAAAFRFVLLAAAASFLPFLVALAAAGTTLTQLLSLIFPVSLRVRKYMSQNTAQ